MASTDTGRITRFEHRYRAERREARLLFCIVYPFSLAMTLVTLVVGVAAGRPDAWRSFRSAFRVARSDAEICVGYVFR